MTEVEAIPYIKNKGALVKTWLPSQLAMHVNETIELNKSP
jgi:hypothetical protein